MSRKDFAPIGSPKYEDILNYKEVSPNLRPPLHPKKSTLNMPNGEHLIRSLIEENKDVHNSNHGKSKL